VLRSLTKLMLKIMYIYIGGNSSLSALLTPTNLRLKNVCIPVVVNLSLLHSYTELKTDVFSVLGY
jgi:hypothetical protein